jgi:protein SCO1/2
MTDKAPPRSKLREVRLLLWALVALAIVGFGAVLLIQRVTVHPPQAVAPAANSSFGGPFTLVGADGKPFSSAKLLGKPYVMYFGFTRCGDVCPTTLSRLVKLRKQAGGDTFHIVFVTIDPTHDGPKEVGQYAQLFNSPIIGLTGSQSQIDRVKKQYGIYAQAVPNAPMGQQMEHTATVLLFDSHGQLMGTVTPNESDADALATLKQLVA